MVFSQPSDFYRFLVAEIEFVNKITLSRQVLKKINTKDAKNDIFEFFELKYFVT